MNRQIDIDKVQRILRFNFFFSLFWVLLLVVIYEMEWVAPGSLADAHELQFLLLSAMEIVTIVCIPLALKLFVIKGVRRRLVEKKGEALLRLGFIRHLMLWLPMIFNTYFYYNTMSAAFGYMAIILVLCMFFVYPSMSRCYAETEDVKEEDKK